MLYVNSVIDHLTHCRHPVHMTCLHFSCTRLYTYVTAVACVCQGPALARAIHTILGNTVSCTLLRYSEDMIFESRVEVEPRRVWFLAQLSDFFLRDGTFGACPCSVQRLQTVAAELLKLTGQHRGGHDTLREATEPPMLAFFLLSPKRKQRPSTTLTGLTASFLADLNSSQTWLFRWLLYSPEETSPT